MKGASYKTSLIGLFASLGQFKKTREVNIKSIKNKSNHSFPWMILDPIKYFEKRR